MGCASGFVVTFPDYLIRATVGQQIHCFDAYKLGSSPGSPSQQQGRFIVIPNVIKIPVVTVL